MKSIKICSIVCLMAICLPVCSGCDRQRPEAPADTAYTEIDTRPSAPP